MADPQTERQQDELQKLFSELPPETLEKLLPSLRAAARKRSQTLVKKAEEKPDSPLAKEPVTIIHLGGLVLLIVALVVVLLLMPAEPSKSDLGITIGIVIAVVMLGQMLLTRQFVFAPSTVAEILKTGLEHFFPRPKPGAGPAPDGSDGSDEKSGG